MSVLLTVHAVTYWVAVVLVAGSVVTAWMEARERLSARLLSSALVVLTLSAGARWAVTGHPPIFGTFENSIAASWALGVGLVVGRPRGWLPEPLPRALMLWFVPILVLGLFFDRTPYPLTISERSLVVDVHVVFAWIAHTILLAASTAAALVVSGKARGDQERWDTVMFRGAGTGFAAMTFMIAVGATYSYLLFAEWFKWEMVETFAAAAWVGYSLVLHSALMFRWRGRKLAWAVLTVLPLTLGLFWVWSFYSGTYHYFEIPAIRAE